MNHREVMQQALEALEQDNPAGRTATIAAIKAALAEQCQCGDRPAADCPGAWEPGCDLGANEAHAKVHEPQEPVAWVHPTQGHMQRRTETMSPEVVASYERGGWTPLYTHPAPQRQPLSDEEIKTVYRELEAQRLYARVLCKAVDAATDFIGTVAGGASWWDDVWADHYAALDRARERITLASVPSAPTAAPQRQPQKPVVNQQMTTEPVAWLNKWANADDGVPQGEWQSGYDAARRVVKAHLNAIDATQRQPLTEDEAWDMWEAVADRGKKGVHIVIDFARAIEDAVWEKINGIGGQDDTR